jgi:hypothetical protein
LGGYDIPASFQGKSLLAGKELLDTKTLPEDEEAIIRERLSGLGYIS